MHCGNVDCRVEHAQGNTADPAQPPTNRQTIHAACSTQRGQRGQILRLHSDFCTDLLIAPPRSSNFSHACKELVNFAGGHRFQQTKQEGTQRKFVGKEGMGRACAARTGKAQKLTVTTHTRGERIARRSVSERTHKPTASPSSNIAPAKHS
jgi:hypothetical protein